MLGIVLMSLGIAYAGALILLLAIKAGLCLYNQCIPLTGPLYRCNFNQRHQEKENVYVIFVGIQHVTFSERTQADASSLFI
jgi:hypothetical protein